MPMDLYDFRSKPWQTFNVSWKLQIKVHWFVAIFINLFLYSFHCCSLLFVFNVLSNWYNGRYFGPILFDIADTKIILGHYEPLRPNTNPWQRIPILIGWYHIKQLEYDMSDIVNTRIISANTSPWKPIQTTLVIGNILLFLLLFPSSG